MKIIVRRRNSTTNFKITIYDENPDIGDLKSEIANKEEVRQTVVSVFKEKNGGEALDSSISLSSDEYYYDIDSKSTSHYYSEYYRN